MVKRLSKVLLLSFNFDYKNIAFDNKTNKNIFKELKIIEARKGI